MLQIMTYKESIILKELMKIQPVWTTQELKTRVEIRRTGGKPWEDLYVDGRALIRFFDPSTEVTASEHSYVLITSQDYKYH